MNKVFILVEGQTEETFVRDMLTHHLAPKNVYTKAVLATTKRVQGSSNFRGGITSYGQVKFDIQRLLHDTSVDLVTTFIDYYHLPSDFPGYKSLPSGTCHDRANYLEQALQEDIKHPKFMPYLALHEFEAMLFVNPEKIERNFPGTKKLPQIQKIKASFTSPEEINDEEPPSKRLMALFKGYEKTFHSPLIVEEIGLEAIRRECSHFAGWLKQLEELSDT